MLKQLIRCVFSCCSEPVSLNSQVQQQSMEKRHTQDRASPSHVLPLEQTSSALWDDLVSLQEEGRQGKCMIVLILHVCAWLVHPSFVSLLTFHCEHTHKCTLTTHTGVFDT